MTHRCLVRYYDGKLVHEAGSSIEYNGFPNWKFEPSDPVEYSKWQSTVADPERVRVETHKQLRGMNAAPSQGTDGLPQPLPKAA